MDGQALDGSFLKETFWLLRLESCAEDTVDLIAEVFVADEWLDRDRCAMRIDYSVELLIDSDVDTVRSVIFRNDPADNLRVGFL